MAEEGVGTQKAAILLMSIGEEAAASVLKHMDAEEVQKLGGMMALLRDISREQVSDALGDLLQAAQEKTSIGFGSSDYIRKVLVDAVGERKAASLLNRIITGGDSAGIDALRWMDAKTVAQIIGSEHPQIIAMVLAHLSPEQAADTLKCLPAESHGEVAKRIACLTEVPETALAELDAIVEQQSQEKGTARSTAVGGVRAAADIINLLGTEQEAAILEFIREGDETLGQQIQDSLFIFDNLLGVDDRGMQRLLREVQSDVLSLALKGADPAIAEKIYSNMSKRAAEILRDDLAAKGPVRLAEVEEAQRTILTTAQQLAEEGEIVLGGGGDDFV